MKLTSTLRTIVASSAVLALTAWGFLNIASSDTTVYQPRAERPAAQPDGAMEIRRMLLADADGNIDHAGLQQLRRKVAKTAAKQSMEKANSLSWVELGPDNIGGRTRAIVAVGNNTLYAGGVSGGLWKSTNRGDNWTQMLAFPSLMVGSMAISGDGTMYVGTGSRFDGNGSGEGGSEFRGEGIWMSTDEGASWTMVDGTVNYRTTDALVADPNQDNRIWFGSEDAYGFIESGDLTTVPSGSSSPSDATDIAIALMGVTALWQAPMEESTVRLARTLPPWSLSPRAAVKGGTFPSLALDVRVWTSRQRTMVTAPTTPLLCTPHPVGCLEACTSAVAMELADHGRKFGLPVSLTRLCHEARASTTWRWGSQSQTLPWLMSVASNSGVRVPTSRHKPLRPHLMRRGSILVSMQMSTKSFSWMTAQPTASCTWRPMVGFTARKTTAIHTPRAIATTT